MALKVSTATGTVYLRIFLSDSWCAIL